MSRMAECREAAVRRMPAFLKSPRLWGITGLSLAAYLLVFGVFGRIDISGLLPVKLATAIEMDWPDLPFFTVEQRPVNGGKNQEIFYTVPTRQLTAKEIVQLEASKPAPKPPAPAK